MINMCNQNLPKQPSDSLNVINLTHFEVQITNRHSTSDNTYICHCGVGLGSSNIFGVGYLPPYAWS